jgi:hypothetical protein
VSETGGRDSIARTVETVTLRAMRLLATRRQRWVTAGSLLGIMVLTLLWGFRRGPSAAERWMDQRRAEGEKFTLEELGWDNRPAYGSPVMEVLEATQGSLSRFQRPTGPTEAFVGDPPPGRSYVLWQQTHMQSQARFRASWDLMEDQLRNVEPALAEVRAALHTIVQDPGGSYTDPSVRVNFVALREAANALSDAVILELHRSEPDRTLTNLVSLIRLSRQHQDHYRLVTQMIRTAITRQAVEASWQALQWPSWTDAQLKLIQTELAQCSLLDPVVHAIELERAVGLHWYAVLEQEGTSGLTQAIAGPRAKGRVRLVEQLHTWLWRRLWQDDDLHFFLEHHQANLVALRGLARGEACVPLLKSLSEANDFESSLTREFLGFRYTLGLFSAAALPNYRLALDTVAQTETRRRLALIAIALERFRLRHGKWPRGLGTLVPECISGLPPDPYSAAPFRYRTDGNGPPWLYSVGPNGRDDGGSAEPDSGLDRRAPRNRDLDLVWPQPIVPGD